MRTVDVVTFSRCGEPTLNLDLGVIAQQAKARIADLPKECLKVWRRQVKFEL